MIAQPRPRAWIAGLFLLTAAISGCGPGSQKGSAPATTAAGDAADAPLPPSATEAAVPEALREGIFKPFTGDFDAMLKRRIIRIGAPFNRTFYFVDQGQQRGVAYEFGSAFEADLNKRLKTDNATKVHVVFVPLSRDILAPALLEGKVDLVIAQVTIRPELQALVDFSKPTRTNVSEIVVTGPGGPSIAAPDELSGKEVWVRRDSKYWASLVALNGKLKAEGKPEAVLREAPGNLEDDDLLEMVSAGLIPTTIVDDYLAEFWNKIFTNLSVHKTVTVRTGASLAVPFRKNSPQLAAAVNDFLSRYGGGTAFGNTIEKRYLVSTKFAKNATSDAERQKFLALIDLFRTYGGQYDLDYLLMAAQGYQESGLDQNAKSGVGAIGVMQIMPATGKELNVGDITKMDANIHGGVKYMRFMMDRYYKDEPMDNLNKALMTFASYNAGPGRVRQLRREAEKRGLNPNVWFGNVEQIASERVGRETVTYVSNIYKYYVAYKLVMDEASRRAAAKSQLQSPARK